jgi:hypothetical protein
VTPICYILAGAIRLLSSSAMEYRFPSSDSPFLSRTLTMPLSSLLLRMSLTVVVMLSAACTGSRNEPATTSPPASNQKASDAVPKATETTPSPTDETAVADTFVLPGPLSRGMDLAALQRVYGQENVRRETLEGAEGATAEGLVVYGDDPERRLELWMGQNAGAGIVAASASGEGSRWHLDNGVRIGMTLDELAALNGAPVSFTGMDWDYGGAITNWHGGRLQPVASTGVTRSVRLGHGDVSDPHAYAMGDAEFRSDDPAYPKQGRVLFVESVTVGL